MVSRIRRLGRGSSPGSSSDPSTTTGESEKKIKRSLEGKRRKFKFFRKGHHNGAAAAAAAVPGRIDTERREELTTASSSEDSSGKTLPHTTILTTNAASAMDPIDVRGLQKSVVTAKSASKRETEMESYNAMMAAATAPALPAGFCSPLAMLQGSYFDGMCGSGSDPWLLEEEERSNRLNQLPDDPSVQESIECVFSPQGKEDLWKQDDSLKVPFADLMSPSTSQQCLLKNRSLLHLPSQFKQHALALSPRKAAPLPQKPVRPFDFSDAAATNTCGPVMADVAETTSAVTTATTECPQRECACCNKKIPILDPEQWPQRPLLMRPTPNGGTVVKGIRFAGKTDYIWEAQQSTLTWPQALRRHWNNPAGSSLACDDSDKMMCERCMILPINNGKELSGESLVTDFESDLFCGSILVRLKDSQGTTTSGKELDEGYFHGVHRRYQVVVRGKFKKQIPWTECFAGFQLERPAGKLPPKWIVNGALNLVRFFAPQLQTRMHGPHPFSLTPLGSTPQSLIVSSENTCKMDKTMEVPQEEPTDSRSTLTGHVSTASSSMQRARFRKKCFDKLFSARSVALKTDCTKVYTFEFLQHLLSFDDFSIELGAMVGSIHLQGILNGQPLQIMASHKHPVPDEPNAVQNRLWCFDIWHEMLIADAKRHEARMAAAAAAARGR